MSGPARQHFDAPSYRHTQVSWVLKTSWGFNTVEVFTSKGNVRIGSDQPDRLIAAIGAAHE